MSLFSQNNGREKKRDTQTESEAYFSIRGAVYDKKTSKPFKGVNIRINGGKYTRTDSNGKFVIVAKIGDELIVSHDSFNTVTHIIEDRDRISIEIIDEEEEQTLAPEIRYEADRFNRFIDSADVYLKKDAEKSIKFIGDALKSSNAVLQNAEAHELLGDVYTHWNQDDLAISAYKISLQNKVSNAVKLKLAHAYLKNNDPDKSLIEYKNLKKRSLSNYQKIELLEGLGNVYLQTNNFEKAIESYEDALRLAKRYMITPKVTDLNSKLAQVYSAKGDKDKAKGYFDNTLDLAKKENKNRAIEAQITVAEFNNKNAQYDDEILLRQQALNTIEDIEQDTLLGNDSPLTQQKQNYKLGNAYYLNNDYENAIPYLEKSIEEAGKRGDLEIKKDALRKLSDVQFSSGRTEEAIATIGEFKNVVDELYIKKQQEISQAARFSKKLSEQQSRITSLESDRELSKSNYDLTNERNKRQELIIYSLIGGLVLLLITGYFMYKYIKQQKFANNLLALKSLRSQMNPHFIFNALNSVNSFIATNDERAANRYLTDFSFLMRAVLENSEADFIPLKKEIELLELYTKLEHFRFQDKFDYKIDIDEDIDVNTFQIPPMLLQPYIENAVWHGLRYKDTKGMLQIKIHSQSKSEIAITITDDGIGRARSKALKTQNQKKQNSKGMTNIKKRVAILNTMYKDKVDVAISDFQNENDAGTKVMVTLKKD